MSRFSLKSDQQRLEFVNPCERSLTHKAPLVHQYIEMSLTSTLDTLSIALVLCNVGLNPAIPQYLSRSSCIEAAICVEDRSFVIQSTSLQVSEDIPKLLHKLIPVIMIASYDACRCKNVPISIGYRQNVAGLGLLSALIGDFFAPFFAALWLPSRLSSDKLSSPLIEITLASNSRWRLPSLLHLRK